VKCKIHGIEKKQGGCFQNIYEWCPKCEDADTEPLTDPGLGETGPLANEDSMRLWVSPYALAEAASTGTTRAYRGFTDASKHLGCWTSVTPVLLKIPGHFLTPTGRAGEYAIALGARW
jgi:hypothetical protein